MFNQGGRFVSVTTPLGTDTMVFYRVKGHEALSRLFEYEVDLLVEDKTLVHGGFPVEKVLGQGMTIDVTLPNGGHRYLHGLVSQFRHHGTEGESFLFRATLRPWLWFLTRTSDCRIFQDLSVPDIIKKVFKDNGFSDFKLDLTKTYKPRTYCVQYRETDFNFVSRLMECEGIFYFFKHEQSKHTLIIADSASAYQTINDYDSILYFPPENKERRKHDHIFQWHKTHEVQSGTYILNDYDFEKPQSNLIAKTTQIEQHSHSEGEQYDYPGGYTETTIGEPYSTVRLDELKTNYEVIEGKGNALGLTAGMLFSLKNYYVQPDNTKHIITSVDFLIQANQYRTDIGGETYYEFDFKAIPSTQTFRPPRLTPVPFVQGPQTAMVVGKNGEDIWTDRYGRIKVQFHWDRLGKKDENSSCWLRVATPLAGKQWGFIALPRIGHEVVVSFLEGNPDQPLITGSVYNNNQMPPYSLPANQTQSGIKTRSSKEGTAENFNEIRFEDKKGSEELYVHAEKDFNCVIENNETRKIGLDKKDKGNQTIEIQNDRTVTLKEGNDKLDILKGDRTTNINQGSDTLNINMGDYSLNISKGKATVEAMTSIELKVGSNSIKIAPSGITIQAVNIAVSADTVLDLKGNIKASLDGGGMLILSGALTKIN